MSERSKVRTCFWFARRGIDAARFYVGLLPDSRIDSVTDHGHPDDPMTLVTFTLEAVGHDTRLTVVESGFEHIPLERRAEAFSGNDGGWTHQVQLVTRYVAADWR